MNAAEFLKEQLSRKDVDDEYGIYCQNCECWNRGSEIIEQLLEAAELNWVEKWVKPWGKCPDCGYGKLSKIFLGWFCSSCGKSFYPNFDKKEPERL